MDEDWSRKTDDEVFKNASEQAGSQASYWRDTEIRRRLYILEKENLDMQRHLLKVSIDAGQQQKSAIAEMRRQSTFMLLSVIAAFLAAAFTLLAAWIQ